ncbi:hypothetical protein IG631_24159 [Alternaria alternata]|nr:hypothetical protein IG631_24159 [Alternaria alternata]
MEHQIHLERPANQIQSRYQSPRFGPYLIHNTICRWKGDEPSESRTSCAEIRQRKPPAGRSPIAIGNMYRRLRFVQVCGNGEYVRMVLGDDAVEALAMMPYYSKLQLTVLQFQQAAETVTSLLFLNLSSSPLPRPPTPSETSRLWSLALRSLQLRSLQSRSRAPAHMGRLALPEPLKTSS